MSTPKPGVKVIKCEHILHNSAAIFSGIDIGDGRVVLLCKRCEESIVGRVLASLYREAIKDYMKDKLPTPKEMEKEQTLPTIEGGTS